MRREQKQCHPQLMSPGSTSISFATRIEEDVNEWDTGDINYMQQYLYN